MKTLIITGGKINSEFAYDYINNQGFSYIIGADRGIEFCYEKNIMPSIIMGDFDSIDPEILKYFEAQNIEIKRFNPEKDDTDTQMAIKHALKINSSEIAIIGATGSRIDHVLGNIQSMALALKKSVLCSIVDENNIILLAEKYKKIKKSDQFGKYVSLIPLTSEVTGITLKGFKYPLNNYTMKCDTGVIGVSNEIRDEYGEIIFDEGILIIIQSKD